MRIIHCEDYGRLSADAAALVLAEIARRADALVCAATGRSPSGLYAELARNAAADPTRFDRLRIVQLDEWGGVPATDPGSCAHYLRTRLLDPLGIPSDRFLALDATAEDPAAECGRVRTELERSGPIDICVLGLGVNGHIGFNEPAPSLTPRCHVAQLSPTTRRHAMVRSLEHQPTYGLTLGMGEILASRRILLLVTGEGKRGVTHGLLAGDVTTSLPASLLWLHPNVDCFVERSVLES
ncbi:MAG: galactosamine-6-phosphate isomerase [Gemmatimonadota bacterium]|nr:galactosamine-6-phosphate isomerase [Gemmatimonadota bacterium]